MKVASASADWDFCPGKKLKRVKSILIQHQAKRVKQVILIGAGESRIY